jgi:DNA polymerase III epsilon subunit-like protein
MLIVDVEASGTEADLHSIVSVGAFELESPERRFYEECRVFDGANIDPDALLVNGFTEAEITNPAKQAEAELVTKFLEWSQHIGDRTLAGQNVSFDRDMLRAAAGRAGLAWDLAHRTIDTHTLCFMHMVKNGGTPPIDPQHRRSALNLDTVLEYCGIPEEPKPHNAMTGALCHGEVISRLLYGKKLLPEFSQYGLPW